MQSCVLPVNGKVDMLAQSGFAPPGVLSYAMYSVACVALLTFVVCLFWCERVMMPVIGKLPPLLIPMLNGVVSGFGHGGSLARTQPPSNRLTLVFNVALAPAFAALLAFLGASVGAVIAFVSTVANCTREPTAWSFLTVPATLSGPRWLIVNPQCTS